MLSTPRFFHIFLMFPDTCLPLFSIQVQESQVVDYVECRGVLQGATSSHFHILPMLTGTWRLFSFCLVSFTEVPYCLPCGVGPWHLLLLLVNFFGCYQLALIHLEKPQVVGVDVCSLLSSLCQFMYFQCS